MKIKISGLQTVKIEDDEGNDLCQTLAERGVHIEKMVVFLYPERVVVKADIIFDDCEIDVHEYVECSIKQVPELALVEPRTIRKGD